MRVSDVTVHRAAIASLLGSKHLTSLQSDENTLGVFASKLLGAFIQSAPVSSSASSSEPTVRFHRCIGTSHGLI